MHTFEKQRIGLYCMTLCACLTGCSVQHPPSKQPPLQLTPSETQLWPHMKSIDQLPTIPDPSAKTKRIFSIPQPTEDVQQQENAQKTESNHKKKASDKIEIPRKKERAVANNHKTVSEGDKIAYLTFDDGPSNNTKKILAILKIHNIPATFFVLGSNTNEGKALYKQIVAEGHAIGNHSYSHNYKMIYQSPEAFRKDVHKLDQLLEKTIGFRPDILRFPGGSNNHVSWKAGGKGVMNRVAQAMKEDGYQYFDWNVSSADASVPVQDKDVIIQSVLGESRGKQTVIILMHDAAPKTTTVEALPIVINKLQAEGYRFEKLNKSSFTYQFLKP